MRIAIWHNLPSGGGKRALYSHVRGLVESGHTVDVWCPSSADATYMPLKSLVRREEVMPLPGTRPQPVLLTKLLKSAQVDTTMLNGMDGMLEHAKEFAARVNNAGYDVVLVEPCRAFLTPFVGRFLSLPSVLYLQEPSRHLYEATPRLPWIAEEDAPTPWWHPATLRHWIGSAARVDPVRVLAREEWTNIRAFDRVLVNSAFSRESVLRTLGVSSRVCYLGIDAAAFAFADRAREPFVLSVGEFAVHKRPEFIIRGVAASRSRPPLVWVANRVEAGLARKLRALAGELAVQLDIREMVTESGLVDLYQRASAFLYAPRLEPFGFVPLEANACGAPVIAIAEGGIRETIVHEETGVMVDAEPESMGTAIDGLMQDSALARRLGRNGAAHVRERWTLDAAKARLERQLLDVCNSRRGTSDSSRTGLR